MTPRFLFKKLRPALPVDGIAARTPGKEWCLVSFLHQHTNKLENVGMLVWESAGALFCFGGHRLLKAERLVVFFLFGGRRYTPDDRQHGNEHDGRRCKTNSPCALGTIVRSVTDEK